MRSSSGYGPYRKKHYRGDPWHLKPFLKGNRVTFPYQHDSVILYTGINKHIFFHQDSEKRPRKSRNPKSILTQRVLNPGNSHINSNPNAKGHRTEGVFFGILPVAKHFATQYNHHLGGAVLEIQIPTKALITLIRKLSDEEILRYKAKHGKDPEMFETITSSEGLERLKEKFGSPEGFRRKLLTEEDKGRSGEGIQWVVEQEIPLKYITGVWDVENSRKPVFTSFDEFLKTLKSQYGEDLPTESEYVSDINREKIRRKILEEAEEYKEILELAGFLEAKIRNFRQILNMIEKDGYDREKGRGLIQRIDRYNEKRKELSELLQRDFDVDDSKPVIQLKNLPADLANMEEIVTSAEEGLREAIADEQQHYHKINWRRKDIKKEQIFEQRVNQKIGKLILRLPSIQYEKPIEIIEEI